MLSASWTGLAQGMIHQEGSNSSTETCSIPASLSSFQGKVLPHFTTSSVDPGKHAFVYNHYLLSYISQPSLYDVSLVHAS